MILKFKREIITIILIICMLFTISAISAADSSTDAVSATNATVEAASEDVDSDNNLAMENDVESLGDGESSEVGTFSQLGDLVNSVTINPYDTVYLENDYVYSDSDTSTSISLSKHMTIDGKGHKIDAKGKARIFTLTSGYNIIFKNITFCNGYGTWGGAISCNNKVANGPARQLKTIFILLILPLLVIRLIQIIIKMVVQHILIQIVLLMVYK